MPANPPQFNRELEKEILENQKDLTNLERRKKIFDYWIQYDGEDKIVLFSELLKKLGLSKPAEFFSKIPTLDKLVDGFRTGQLVVVSAPTGQGKTSFCQTLTENFYKQQHKCLWFTFEVPLQEFVEKFSETVPEFYVPMQLRSSNIEWLKLKILEGMAKYGTTIVFIDHLHFLIDMQMLSRTNTSLTIGSIMRDLKTFALENNVLIFLVSHLKKTKLDMEEDPSIDDIRDSSFISQESDIVLVMKRKQTKRDGQIVYINAARVLVAKNRRTGKLGTINLIYDNNRFLETDITHHEQY